MHVNFISNVHYVVFHVFFVNLDDNFSEDAATIPTEENEMATVQQANELRSTTPMALSDDENDEDDNTKNEVTIDLTQSDEEI